MLRFPLIIKNERGGSCKAEQLCSSFLFLPGIFVEKFNAGHPLCDAGW